MNKEHLSGGFIKSLDFQGVGGGEVRAAGVEGLSQVFSW